MINDIKAEIERRTHLPANVIDQVVNSLGEIVSERYPQYAGMIGPILGIPMGGATGAPSTTASGATGTTGATGSAGTTGATGTSGTAGTAGATGTTSTTGAAGSSGMPDLGGLAGEIGGLFGGQNTSEPGTGAQGGGSNASGSS